MQIHIRGRPDIDNMSEHSRQIMFEVLLSKIKLFYQNADNRIAYEVWLSKRKTTATLTNADDSFSANYIAPKL